MTRVLLLLALAAELALGTWWLGWWSVPLLAGVDGVVLGEARRPGRLAAVAGAVAWGGLLLGLGVAGFPVAGLATRLAALLQLPVAALYLVLMALPALLAGCAAALGGALRPR